MHRTTTAAAATALFLGLALGAPLTAQAHGDNLEVVVIGHRQGHIAAEVTWANDGDAVDEQVAGTVQAVSADGARTTGPWPLVRDTASATTWTTAEALPSGHWKVTVEVGFPSLGRAEREVTVDPLQLPQTTVSTPASPQNPPPSPAAPTRPASADTHQMTSANGEPSFGPYPALLAALGLAVATAALIAIRGKRLRRWISKR
ncbi:hypothetical protein ABZ891_34245 [Streptomyces sp. NPDC047023]|uniref:hypothetical protein n=1 Tax=Streptomyces sp. NPDC047023 TaxID=3155139 RepID=UPI0033C67123